MPEGTVVGRPAGVESAARTAGDAAGAARGCAGVARAAGASPACQCRRWSVPRRSTASLYSVRFRPVLRRAGV